MTSGLHLQQEERIIAMEAQTQMQQLVPVFNGNEYELWSIKMRTLLMSRDLWDVIESETSDQPMEEELVKSQRIKDLSSDSKSYLVEASMGTFEGGVRRNREYSGYEETECWDDV